MDMQLSLNRFLICYTICRMLSLKATGNSTPNGLNNKGIHFLIWPEGVESLLRDRCHWGHLQLAAPQFHLHLTSDYLHGYNMSDSHDWGCIPSYSRWRWGQCFPSIKTKNPELSADWNTLNHSRLVTRECQELIKLGQSLWQGGCIY